MQIIPQEERIALPDNIEEADFAIWRVLAVGPGRPARKHTPRITITVHA